jgi:hypothetical protein
MRIMSKKEKRDIEKVSSLNSERLMKMQVFLQNATMTIDYLNWWVASKFEGEEGVKNGLFEYQLADDSELTEEKVVSHIEGIAKHARASFSEG